MDKLTTQQTTDSAQEDNLPVESRPLSKLIFILGGIILLILGLFIGYYFSQSSKSVTKSQTVPSLIPSPEESNDTEELKTYMNEEYGFRFKYPTNLLLTNPVSNSIIIKI